jgi:anti-sigma regulatory factor (Ser/Thr protein kinase)
LKRLSISIESDTSLLKGVRESLFSFMSPGLDSLQAARVVLALDEALANIILHGYGLDRQGTIQIDMEEHPDFFRFTITDDAPEFNPLETPSPDIDDYLNEGSGTGIGMYLYKKLMEVGYEKTESGSNRLTLVKKKEIPSS